MNIREIQMKIYEKLKPSGWGEKLRMFLLSEEFAGILKHLYETSSKGRRFTPTLKDLFRAFEECPYDELKIVMVGQDPYPQPDVANGIAFCCAKTGKIQASLKHMFHDIEKTVYPNGYEWNPDLSRWSRQGILMLNTALTCEIGKAGSHAELWRPFMTNLFDMLGNYNSGLIYVFMGNKAKQWHSAVPPTNYKYFTTHPAAASYNGGVWDSGNLFNNISTVIEKNYGETIIW